MKILSNHLNRILFIFILSFVSFISFAQTNFEKLSQAYFDNYFEFYPTAATAAGFHHYDSRYEDYSAINRARYLKTLKQFEKQLVEFPENKLSAIEKQDLRLLLSDIHSQQLTLETIRPWETNPDIYSSEASESAFVLISRKFASPEKRMISLIAREKQMIASLATARVNLKNPVPEFSEIALAQLPGVIRFFQKDVPMAFQDVNDPKLKAEFTQINNQWIKELTQYQQWVQTELMPKSKGDFRIGAATFRKKLLYDEMVDTPLEKILELGFADLHKNQDAFAALAKEIDPKKTPLEVLAMLGADYPPPSSLLSTFQNTFDSLIQFIDSKKIITIPSTIRPILEETPPFMRATTFASMDTPGPYEKVAKEAFFNVTLPETNWTPTQVAEYMAAFNIGTIAGTSIHETYPGHYVQFLWVQQAPTQVRKLIGAMTNAEGWAHYCEQMMLDEGFNQVGVGAKSKQVSQFMRLGQLQNALLRDARLIVGIKMHTGQMSFKEAVDFFIHEGYQSPSNAHRETLRGTYNPTYLYYTLGKLEILKLREDLKKQQGDKFSLQAFHNAFMKQGFPPIKIVRETLLGNDSPTL